MTRTTKVVRLESRRACRLDPERERMSFDHGALREMKTEVALHAHCVGVFKEQADRPQSHRLTLRA